MNAMISLIRTRMKGKVWDIEESALVWVRSCYPAGMEGAAQYSHGAGQDEWAGCCCLCRWQTLSSHPQGSVLQAASPLLQAGGSWWIDICVEPIEAGRNLLERRRLLLSLVGIGDPEPFSWDFWLYCPLANEQFARQAPSETVTAPVECPSDIRPPQLLPAAIKSLHPACLCPWHNH